MSRGTIKFDSFQERISFGFSTITEENIISYKNERKTGNRKIDWQVARGEGRVVGRGVCRASSDGD